MILESFRVTEFRSVKDSGWIDTEQITALIGTNESGKTNILLPLWKLNPADEGKIDLKADLPRDEYHTYRLADPKPIFIRAKYSLLDEEKLELSKISGHPSNDFSQVIVSKDFDGNLFYDFPSASDQGPVIIDKAREIIGSCKSSLEAGNDAAGKTEIERRERALQILRSAADLLTGEDAPTVLAQVNTEISKFDDDVKSSVTCATMADASQRLQPLLSESNLPTLSQSKEVTTYIKEHMPKYVYYSNYGNLDSQIYLPQVLQNIGRADLGVKDAAKARTLKTLFKFVQLDPKEITELGSETTGNLSQAQIDTISEKRKSVKFFWHPLLLALQRPLTNGGSRVTTLLNFKQMGISSEFGFPIQLDRNALNLNQGVPAYNGFLASTWYS